ncbi:MAG: hypothetical protein ACM3OF_09800 [Gemmatimonas sp.]
MHRLPEKSPAPSGIVQWLFDLATWLVARALQMPAPLVRAIGLFLFAQLQEADRRLLALCRPTR